ncbi:class I SAM-dependent methyltransferase [Leptothoe spongobia]|uniref:Methyltransferase domain-containing protein n=1 Tax=Leptothoe spongobia TAU-MAC 1115 TaxID=1967444 RepID=A0A947DCY0_9CYAN|nr:methyltransferase domain-containing protein [Leptothoe spongobia]MBT9314194.1 methyltransferase domain-containing protein [Leptothoe spongobia TAU-MAC 1115]
MTVQPFLHTTPDDALTDTVEELVVIPFKGDVSRQFRLLLPTSIDTLLDHPATYAAFDQDEYMPYWAQLWPSALMLGQEIAQHSWPGNMQVLEVGCGLGLSGLVALALGMDVVFSDYDVAALEFAALNARRNGFDRFLTLPLDWRCPPDGLQVSLILAADVIYEMRNIRPLIDLMTVVLSPGGECWLADPDRPHREDFQAELVSQGFEFEAMVRSVVRLDQPTVRGTVYRIWRGMQCSH